MINRLTTKYLDLSNSARSRLVDIANRDKQIADQEQSIRNLKRQMKDREAELFEEVGIPKKEGDKAPTDTARKNLVIIAMKKDAAYQDLVGLTEDAQRELDGMRADLDEVLRAHALDKRELDVIAAALNAWTGKGDPLGEHEPIAATAPATPRPAAAVPTF